MLRLFSSPMAIFVHLEDAFGVPLRSTGNTSRNPLPADLSHTLDRKSTRLNSSHLVISYAVFCLKKKNNAQHNTWVSACAERRRLYGVSKRVGSRSEDVRDTSRADCVTYGAHGWYSCLSSCACCT